MKSFFDFIIVRAGTASCASAARLTKNPINRVLLLDGRAGGDDLLVKMPAGWGEIVESPKYSWLFKTQQESHLIQSQINWKNAGVNGGSQEESPPSFIKSAKKPEHTNAVVNYQIQLI